ncbi:MAG: hypothetical protein RMX68_024835 [Aulosira sp. ZfuVER01]|nr:hypothetical protein [Aulosira sp. ZfuVER01]MDZ7997948.1 hypothetical protein [Aulosira sp. DedVER01a]MDZ8054661.1 hypothetical protein [Aulosira sp. ZfuCHP01]
MPTSSPIEFKQPIPASRKAAIYLGMIISTTGLIIFFSGFFVFGSGFIEFIKPDDHPSLPRSKPGQSFEDFNREADARWSQIEAQGRRKEQIFSQMLAATIPRWFGGMALIFTGNFVTALGKKGIARLAEEYPKQANAGFYVEKYYNQGGTMSENHQINIQASSGSNVVYAGNDISGTVTNTISQLQQTNEPNALQLMELLSRLQQVIEAETALSSEDKADALEQVKVLAEAGQKPGESTIQKVARNAIKILRGTAAALPPAAEMFKACNTILPTVAKLLSISI